MSTMIKSLRSGADRAAFEAGKLMRVQRLQLEQKAKEQQRRESAEQLGEAVWRLYVQGRVSDPELVPLCHAIQTISHEIVELQKAIAEVRNEQAARAFKCLDCGHDLNPGEAFCPYCGAKTPQADTEPAGAAQAGRAPATPSPANAPAAKAPATTTCPGCGRAVRTGAVFCGHCGRRQG